MGLAACTWSAFVHSLSHFASIPKGSFPRPLQLVCFLFLILQIISVTALFLEVFLYTMLCTFIRTGASEFSSSPESYLSRGAQSKLCRAIQLLILPELPFKTHQCVVHSIVNSTVLFWVMSVTLRIYELFSFCPVCGKDWKIQWTLSTLSFHIITKCGMALLQCIEILFRILTEFLMLGLFMFSLVFFFSF